MLPGIIRCLSHKADSGIDMYCDEQKEQNTINGRKCSFEMYSLSVLRL